MQKIQQEDVVADMQFESPRSKIKRKQPINKCVIFQLLFLIAISGITIVSLSKILSLTQKQAQMEKRLEEASLHEKQMKENQNKDIKNLQLLLKDSQASLGKSEELILGNLNKYTKSIQESLKDRQSNFEDSRKNQTNNILEQIQTSFNTQLTKINEQLKKNTEKQQKENQQLKQQLQSQQQQFEKLTKLLIDKKQQQKMPFKKQFTQVPHQLKFHPTFKWYNRNHAHYLDKKQVKTVLEINCTAECQKLYKEDVDYKKMNVTFYENKGNKALQQNNTYDWVIVRYNATGQKQAFFLAQYFVQYTNKGLTFIFNNLIQYRQFNAKYRELVNDLMAYYRFEYDEMISLNLRRRQGKILLVFSNEVKRSTFPFKKPMKNQIAIQFQIKFEENIPYLRQWLGYHIYLGIDKFFIYDNNGSLGEVNKSNTTANKYGFSFDCMSHTNQDIIKEWEDIWEQYYEHIVYLPWQYLDEKGEITYAQMESMEDFINNFEDVTTYVGFIDADEMLFSEKDLNFGEFLTQKSLEGYSSIVLRQRKFITRFCAPHSRVLDINLTFEVNTVKWAEKLFLQTAQFYPGPSPHTLKTFHGKLYTVEDEKEWRFNHYNLIERMISWSHTVRGATATKLSHNNLGRRYKQVLDKICNGKCSQNFAVTCKLDSRLFSCPIDGKEYPIEEKKPKSVDNNVSKTKK